MTSSPSTPPAVPGTPAKVRRPLVAATAGVIGLALGVTAATAWSAPADPGAPSFATNERGQTYGSALGAEVDPDLILAYGVDGKLGYVRTTDLDGPTPASPEEALTTQREMQASGGRTIPLYAVDGVTVIGRFKVGFGGRVEIPASGP